MVLILHKHIWGENMFNKREPAQDDEHSSDSNNSTYITSSNTQTHDSRNSSLKNVAMIGPSIQIDGDLFGDENLVIEGEVRGTIKLISNSLTIGEKGKVTAEVCAHSITVKGFIDGDLYAAEQIRICNTARLRGNIVSPRVSLEDGAKFKGSIEMDPESEALKKVFQDKSMSMGSKEHMTKSKPVEVDNKRETVKNEDGKQPPASSVSTASKIN